MRKRDLYRHIPGFSRLAKDLDRLESRETQLTAENQRLIGLLHRLIFGNETTSSVENGDSESSLHAAGLPVPAGALRFLVAGTEDLKWFLQSGKLGAETLADILARQGQTLGHFGRILDFGCGCGRVLRHLKGMTGAEIHGTDANSIAIRWCERNLGFARFRVNALEPPLPYSDGTFDLVYAFSVFTHLTESLQLRWIDELRRVLVPGGALILTVHGDGCAGAMTPAERAQYDTGKMVIRGQEFVGSNLCAAFHPEGSVRSELARGFDVVEFIPEGAKGNAPQDAYLLRSRAGPPSVRSGRS